MLTILLVEDDEAVRSAVTALLEEVNYRVIPCDTVTAAKTVQTSKEPDLILLDIQLGDGSGYDLCRQVRKESAVPILFLTAYQDEAHLVRAFELGGDDYLSKPFRGAELLSRVKALLRRAGKVDTPLRRSGGLVCDMRQVKAEKNGVPLELTPTEFGLMSYLMDTYPAVAERETLLYRFWDKDAAFVEDNTLTVHISRLREKLGRFQSTPYITTVRGRGYRWEIPVEVGGSCG